MRRVLGLAMLMLLIVPAAGKATCTLSASPVSFGSYIPTTTYTPTGTVTVTRSSGSCSYSITLNTGSSGTYAPRYMTNGSSHLLYQLYTDASRSTVWNNTNTLSGSNTSGNISTSFPVYAQLLSGQYVAPGTYADTITANATGTGINATTNFSVTATVSALCNISVSSLAFGTYTGVVSANTATITTTCTNTTSYTIGLGPGAGTGPTATVTTRHMMNGVAVLNYVLTQDAPHAVNWGNTPGTNTPASANGTGGAVAVTVYGQVAAGQYVKPGAYSDMVVVTINY